MSSDAKLLIVLMVTNWLLVALLLAKILFL